MVILANNRLFYWIDVDAYIPSNDSVEATYDKVMDINAKGAYLITPSNTCLEVTSPTLYVTALYDKADPTLTIEPRPKFLSLPLVAATTLGS